MTPAMAAKSDLGCNGSILPAADSDNQKPYCLQFRRYTPGAKSGHLALHRRIPPRDQDACCGEASSPIFSRDPSGSACEPIPAGTAPPPAIETPHDARL